MLDAEGWWDRDDSVLLAEWPIQSVVVTWTIREDAVTRQHRMHGTADTKYQEDNDGTPQPEYPKYSQRRGRLFSFHTRPFFTRTRSVQSSPDQ
jgi:hypothetical protein